MIDFNISQIEITIKRIDNLQNQVSLTDSRIFDLYVHYDNLIKNLIMDTEGYIYKASDDHQACIDAIASNYCEINRLWLEIQDARKAAESVAKTEGATESDVKRANAVVDNLISLRESIKRRNDKLESIKTQISFDIDKLKKQLEKLRKAQKTLVEVYYAFRGFLESANNELKNYVAKSKKALDAVKGIFTSCKIESSKVLLDYRMNFNSSLQSLNHIYNNVNGKINIYKENIKNVGFIDETAKTALEISNYIVREKEELNKKIKLLDTYIQALKVYEKC